MLKINKKKLWLLLASCFFVTGLSGILLLYNQLYHVSELDMLQSLQHAVEQAAINLNDRMAYAEDILRQVIYDKRVRKSIERKPEEETLENQLNEINDLRELVYSVEKNRSITRVRLYLSDVKMITREGINFFGLRDAEILDEYEPLLNGNGAPVWIGEREVKTIYFEDSCVSLGCIYRTYFSPDRRGWVLALLDLPPDSFDSVLGSLNLPDESAMLAVADADGNIMFGDGDTDLLGEIIQNGRPYGFYKSQKYGDLAYISQELDYGDWILIAPMSRESLLNNRQTTRITLSSLIFGLILLLLTLTGFTVYALYTRSVRDYIRDMNNRLKSPDGSEATPPPAHRALQNLTQNIAELLETNKRLTSENYRAELREREVTLQALQAQINPHFLYNTLDAINWMAIREGANDVSDMVATLAEYFRLSLSQGRSVVSLNEDIEIAKKYLSLYRNRFDYEYNVVWDIEEDASNCALPKLTLQPLIENALQHGIFKRSEKLGGIIRVRAQVQADDLLLEICDNGPGLKQNCGNRQSGGYGLMNVRERLDLYCNGKYHIYIENAPDEGAIVTVRVLRQVVPSV